jgi:hypothetical protein
MGVDDEMGIFNLQFPIVKNINPQLLCDVIKPMTAEEVSKAMGEMFDNFEKETGLKPIIVGDTLPTRVLIPKDNIKK